MDPLSITASIIAILQLTSKVIQYLGDTKDAPKERGRLAIEAANLYSLLTTLRYRVYEASGSNEPWYNAVKSLAGPLDQYKAVLEELSRKVVVPSGDSVGKIKHALTWTFNKGDVDRMLSRMERLKGLIQISLEMDHL